MATSVFGGGIGLLNLTALPADTYSGYYVGPRQGIFNGGPVTDFTCVDFFVTTYVPGSFLVEEKSMSELSTSDRDNTIRSAWLLQQAVSNPGEIGPIQFAIWNLWDPAAPDPDTTSSWVAAALAINPGAFDASSLHLMVPTASLNQRFFEGSLGSPVPEPATLSLIALGLIAMAYLSRRAMRE